MSGLGLSLRGLCLVCLARCRGLRLAFESLVFMSKHGFRFDLGVGYPLSICRDPMDQNIMATISLIWVMMPYCIVLDRRVDFAIPLYVQPSCSPSRQLRPHIPRLASPCLASLLLSKLMVSSTPTFKQGGISCGKCKSVCSYQPLKACTVFCPIFPPRRLHLVMPVRSTFRRSLTSWTPLLVLAGTGSDHRVL